VQVRELRYSPLDREYSTQILNSFNMELNLHAASVLEATSSSPTSGSVGVGGVQGSSAVVDAPAPEASGW